MENEIYCASEKLCSVNVYVICRQFIIVSSVLQDFLCLLHFNDSCFYVCVYDI